MIEITIQIRGLEDVKRAFRDLPKEVAQKALRGALLDGAEVLRKEAQRRAPVRPFWPPKRDKSGRVRLPGALRASIVKRARPRGRNGADMTVSVGATKNVFYWHFVEFGHRLVSGRGKSSKTIGQVRGRPYLKPSFDAAAPAAVNRVIARLGPQIVNIANRLRRRVAKLAA